MDAVMRKHRGTLVRLRSLKPKPENNYNHQRKRTFLLEEEEDSFDRRFHTPYFGRRASSVTQLHHVKPPPHSYHPSLSGTPPQCFNRKASSITDFVENCGKAKRTSDDLGWFGRTATDVSVHQRIIPAPHYGKRTDGPAPWYGRLATFVTDPYRYPGDPTWRSILHHWEEDKRNPKYPTSSDEYAVCPQHVSPRELAAAVAAKRKSQTVVKKAWMTSVDRDRLDKERVLGLSPGSRCSPTPPYALGSSESVSTISTKSAQAERTAAATAAQTQAQEHKADAKPAASSSLKSQASKSHAEDGSDHENSKETKKKKAPDSPKSAGSHHSKGKCTNSPPAPVISISVSSCASGSRNQPGEACNSPRSELLSPTSEKSYKSSQKSPLPAPGSNSSRSGTRRPEENSQCTKSQTTSGQGCSSKRTDQRRDHGGSGTSSSSTSSKSKGTSSRKEIPYNPESITYEDLQQFPDVCATTSAWGGRFKDQERNKPWPVPYEQPHERRTHKKTSITTAPIVN